MKTETMKSTEHCDGHCAVWIRDDGTIAHRTTNENHCTDCYK